MCINVLADELGSYTYYAMYAVKFAKFFSTDFRDYRAHFLIASSSFLFLSHRKVLIKVNKSTGQKYDKYMK